ncbi:MAG TPA: very short patch repair endonuclease, partial [Rhodospirillales bacterium]
TDSLSASARSVLMARIRGVNTSPEIQVRKLLHSLGYRYRLHAKSLPGTPDIAFTGRKKAIFVHGCFWHRHPGCKKATTPKTRTKFWREKFAANKKRDRRKLAELSELGWDYLVIWECETNSISVIRRKLNFFLSNGTRH